MDAKKTNLTVAAVIGLMLVGAILSWFLAPKIIEVGMDSPFSNEQKHALFERHAHETSYPKAATEVCFRLEPGFYKKGDVYGEYVRFKATAEVIDTFVESLQR